MCLFNIIIEYDLFSRIFFFFKEYWTEFSQPKKKKNTNEKKVSNFWVFQANTLKSSKIESVFYYVNQSLMVVR